MIEEMLAYNREFVKNGGYKEYITNKHPDKKISIFPRMETRLTAFFLAARGI